MTREPYIGLGLDKPFQLDPAIYDPVGYTPIFDPDDDEFLGAVSKTKDGSYALHGTTEIVSQTSQSHCGRIYHKRIHHNGLVTYKFNGVIYKQLEQLHAAINKEGPPDLTGWLSKEVMGFTVWYRSLDDEFYEYWFNGKKYYHAKTVTSAVQESNKVMPAVSDDQIRKIETDLNGLRKMITEGSRHPYASQALEKARLLESQNAQLTARVDHLTTTVNDAKEENVFEDPEIKAEMARYERTMMERDRVYSNVIVMVSVLGGGTAALLLTLFALTNIAIIVGVTSGAALIQAWIKRPDSVDYVENKRVEVQAQHQINKRAMKELESGYQFGETSKNDGS